MKHPFQTVALLVGMFLLAQLIGLLIVEQYVDVEKTGELGKTTFKELPLGIERPQVEESRSFVYLTLMLLFGTGLILLIVRFRARFLWKFWYFSALFITLTIGFGAFIDTSIASLIALMLAAWRVIRPHVFISNFSELFVYGGIAAVLVPVMNITSIVIVLFIVSLYDMYAVWKSKHMIALARFQASEKSFAGLFIPARMANKGKESKTASRTMKKEQKSEKVSQKGIGGAVIGGGDIAFPLLFAGVVLKTFGFLLAVPISLGATAALLLLFIYGKKNKFYPALPFLGSGCLVGYGFSLLVHLFL